MDSRVSHVLAGMLGGLLTVAAYMVYDAATTVAAVVSGGSVELAQSARTERREERKEGQRTTVPPGASAVLARIPEDQKKNPKDLKKDGKDPKRDPKKDAKPRDPERSAERKADRELPRASIDRAASLYAEFEARRAAGQDVKMRDLVDQARASGERVRVRDMKAARDLTVRPGSGAPVTPVPQAAPGQAPMAIPVAPPDEPYYEEEEGYEEEAP
jgi:hypothetical protein